MAHEEYALGNGVVVETEEGKDWEKVEAKGINIGKWIRRKETDGSVQWTHQVTENGPGWQPNHVCCFRGVWFLV
ncbi:unnamed protein product [Sphenostylis stenocarpa]|uniref:Uncharacterized protein n=1 Tax=Sphenostylis stenocarpa TaxID=92480 RepID=A0AA86W270_9FABA|nr:unnamed protein product [Sphenostylis stenocarpa]